MGGSALSAPKRKPGTTLALNALMPAAAHASLMDDRQFLEELDNLETHAGAGSVQQREESLDGLDEGLPAATVFPRLTLVDLFEPADEPPDAFPDGEETASASPRDRFAVLACGFVTLMIFGGTGAVVVFHERVAHILALLR